MGHDLDKIANRICGQVRTAGRIEFIRDQGPVRRDIRVKGFEWSPDVLKNLARILWASERAHGYAMSALRLFSKMPSSEFSPDGLLGGRGYIQAVKDMRANLGQSVEVLSSFSDTIYDEINADHWGNADDQPDIAGILEEAQEVKQDPEGYVESQYREEVPGGEGFDEARNPDPGEMNPQVESVDEEPGLNDGWGGQTQLSTEVMSPVSESFDELSEVTKGHSELPGDDSLQGEGKSTVEMTMRTTWQDHGNYASAVSAAANRFNVKRASSSLPVETLSGPRVKHIGPGESDEEFGYYTDHDERPSDDPAGEGFSSYTDIYEDGFQDGVTGDDNPTSGDDSVFKHAYSWLPGSSNEKIMNYYKPGMSEADIEWMKAHSNPDSPDEEDDLPRPYVDPMWEVL